MKNQVFILKTLLIIALWSCSETEFMDNAPQLEITVLSSSGERIENAFVFLYKSELDWKNKLNPILSDETNSQGIILFDNLEEQLYFFFVQKEELTNIESISALEKELQINVKAKITTILK
jgi:hypothetical protein